MENNSKALVIFKKNENDKSIDYNTCKYDTKETRIKKFKSRKKNLITEKEDLSKALVPYKKLKRRKRPRMNISLNTNYVKKNKIFGNELNTFRIFKEKVEINEKIVAEIQKIKFKKN